MLLLFVGLDTSNPVTFSPPLSSHPPFSPSSKYRKLNIFVNFLQEPFASQFLNMQGGMFDHPGRTFSSMAYAWSNCQRDTSDVKVL